MHHVADSHMNAFIRFRLALTEDKPTIKPYNEAEWSKLADVELDPQVSVQILDGLHQRWHRMMRALRETTSPAGPCIPIIGPDHHRLAVTALRVARPPSHRPHQADEAAAGVLRRMRLIAFTIRNTTHARIRNWTTCVTNEP